MADGASRPRAVVLLTGSELVRGTLPDGNGAFLAAELTRLSLEPDRIVVVGDRPDHLRAAIAEALGADLCITSGGLGPTHDDRTVELIAAAAGRPLVVSEALVEEIGAVSRRSAERLRRPYSEFEAGVRKQATLPEGGVSLGLAGTAPAVLLEHEGRVCVALPGPPSELRRLWQRVVEHDAVRRGVARAPARTHRVLRLFGPPESAVARALDEAGGEGGGVEVTICARDLEIHVDLYVESDGASHAAQIERVLRRTFGEQLFAADARSIDELVLEGCRERGFRLATAESCTGGLVGARLTSVPGASDVFMGAIVSYADDVKRDLLGVGGVVLAREGAVSAEAAEAMAEGARRALRADVALAVTGIAGPDGGTPEKPVGLVFLHAAAPGASAAERLVLPGGREDVRTRAAVAGLHLLRRVLTRSASNSRDSAG
ncbi:MAG: CinA family nicotinamide mononucleotide deamidase-related protein [Actinobacteria bacterium]|nr:CinA family nicotinamide mononucleotide deamidase-related protein [Actinomycetota bacterium]